MTNQEIRDKVEQKLKKCKGIDLKLGQEEFETVTRESKTRKNKIKDLIMYMVLKRPATHYPRSRKVHCNPNRARSVSDIYKICNRYFEGLTFKEFINVFVECNLTTTRCSGIRKIVTHKKYSNLPANITSDGSEFDNIRFKNIVNAYTKDGI